MPNPLRIIHLDLDAFFCSVEEQHNPALRGKPFAVGGRPEERGVVASCSYAARRFGVRSAMPMARAVKLCPDLIIVPSRHGVYSQVSRQVMAFIYALTPLVEKVSIDEAFLDVAELEEPAEALALHLQSQVRESLSLSCSLGVATNKLVAKIANDVGKHAAQGAGPPGALTVVPPGSEAEFLAPLPVEMLWGVGPKTAARLTEIGIQTIGELAAFPPVELARRFGKYGLEMSQHARGIDASPIVTEHQAKSFSQEVTFIRDVRDERELRKTIRAQAGEVAEQLQKHETAGSVVKIKLRWPDFTTLTRQVTLNTPTNQAEVIAAAAEELFSKVWSAGKAVRLIGVGVGGLEQPSRQLSLWEWKQPPGTDPNPEREGRLEDAIQALRQRFGENVVQRGKGKQEKGSV